jgi:predicted Zn-dependent peptidase
VAARLGALATYGLPDGYWDAYRAELLAVTAEDVHRAARERLHPAAAVVVITADADAVRPALEALGEGAVEVVDPETLLR